MRERERYLLLEWRRGRKEAMNFAQVQDLIVKEFAKQHGEAGLALCGQRFRIFMIGNGLGICIRVRREAREIMAGYMRTLKASFQLVHVSGSSSQCTRAVKRKFPQAKEAGEGEDWPW